MTSTTSTISTVDAGAQASIGVAARELHLPTVRAEAVRLAEIAGRDRQTHLGYLAEVLAAEVDDQHAAACVGAVRLRQQRFDLGGRTVCIWAGESDLLCAHGDRRLDRSLLRMGHGLSPRKSEGPNPFASFAADSFPNSLIMNPSMSKAASWPQRVTLCAAEALPPEPDTPGWLFKTALRISLFSAQLRLRFSITTMPLPFDRCVP